MKRWRNWARTVETRPSAWHAPASEAEVADIVSACRGRIRVVGAGHSWSAIAAPDDAGMTLDRLTGLTAIVRDGDELRAVVRGGTRLYDLNAQLAERNLALPIVGSVAQQSIAGAIATGTHGSSLVHGNLASLVTSMRVVDGRGEAREIREPGARVHLGALGVVTEVTLRIVPAFRLAGEVEHISVADAARDLETIARSAEYVKVWWLPHAGAFVYRYTRTDEPAQRRVRVQRWFDDNVMHTAVFPFVAFVERLWPATVPAFNRAVVSSLAHKRIVGASPLVLSTPDPVRHRETEAALPLARAGDALARIVAAVDREGLPVGFPLEVRFVRGDDSWMSPAYGVDTCQIGAYAGAPCDAYFAAFWREMRGTRPHWGKEMDHAASDLRPLYPRWDAFAALARDLDPDGKFDNAFTRRTLKGGGDRSR